MKYILAIIAGLVLTGAAFAVPSMAQSVATIGTGGVSEKINLGQCFLVGPDGISVPGHIISDSTSKLVCVGRVAAQTHESIWHGKYDTPTICSDGTFGWSTSNWMSATTENGIVRLTCLNP